MSDFPSALVVFYRDAIKEIDAYGFVVHHEIKTTRPLTDKAMPERQYQGGISTKFLASKHHRN